MGPGDFVVASLFVAVTSLASTGCLENFWPKDDGSAPETGACRSTRRAPTLDTGGERILVEPTNSEVSLIDLEVDGDGSDFIGAVRISHGVGTVQMGCKTLPLAIRDRQMSSVGDPPIPIVNFYALAVGEDRLYDLTFECQKGALRYVWYGGTDGTPRSLEDLTGSCTEISAPIMSVVQFPAIDMPLPRAVSGYTIDGAEIRLASDGTGTIVLDSISNDLFVYDDGAGDPASYLYVLIRDRSGARLSRALLELDSDDPAHVIVYDAITLPSFEDEIGTRTLDATFTKP